MQATAPRESPNRRSHKRSTAARGADVLVSLHGGPQQVQRSVVSVPDWEEYAERRGFRRIPKLGDAQDAMRTLVGFVEWYQTANLWSRVLLCFRRFMRALKVAQRFIRGCYRNYQLLTEAVLVNWRMKEERKIVAERERILLSKHMTAEQKQFVLLETDKVTAPIPDRVKRNTVQAVWVRWLQKFHQAWRAYAQETRALQASRAQRRGGGSTLQMMVPRPRLDFSPKTVTVAYLEKEATVPEELDPFLSDLDARPPDHKRRAPKWTVAQRRSSAMPGSDRRGSQAARPSSVQGSRLLRPDSKMGLRKPRSPRPNSGDSIRSSSSRNPQSPWPNVASAAGNEDLFDCTFSVGDVDHTYDLDSLCSPTSLGTAGTDVPPRPSSLPPISPKANARPSLTGYQDLEPLAKPRLPLNGIRNNLSRQSQGLSAHHDMSPSSGRKPAGPPSLSSLKQPSRRPITGAHHLLL